MLDIDEYMNVRASCGRWWNLLGEVRMLRRLCCCFRRPFVASPIYAARPHWLARCSSRRRSSDTPTSLTDPLSARYGLHACGTDSRAAQRVSLTGVCVRLQLIGKLFHMTSMFTSSQKRLYSHMNSSNVAAGSPPPTEPDAATALQPSGTGGGDDAPPPLANPIDEKTAQSIAAAAGSSGWTVAPPPKPTFTTNAGAGAGAGAQADTAGGDDGAVRERPKPPRSAPSRRRPRRMSLDRQQVALAQMAVVLSTKNVQGDADALRKFEAHDCAHHTVRGRARQRSSHRAECQATTPRSHAWGVWCVSGIRGLV